MPKGPEWTAKQSQDFEDYWDFHLPHVMWYRSMGLEDTLHILTPIKYENDKEYLAILDLPRTYLNRIK